MAIETIAAPPRMTTDEFLARHLDDDGVEFVDGVVERDEMPNFLHGQICLTLGFLIATFVKRQKLGRIGSNDSFIRLANGNVRGPDLLYVSYARIPADHDVPDGAINVPVDLAVEVRSPSQSYKEICDKAIDYVNHGVAVCLVVDPETRSIGIFRKEELPCRVANVDDLELPDVLPGFKIRVSDVFA